MGGRHARQPLAASAASRYALGADGVGAARPCACGEPDHHLALRARRLAPRALRACAAPGARRGLAAIAASRYALGANGVGAARPGACGSLIAASRYALGTEGVGAARPGACMCRPDIARILSGGGGDVEDVVRFALLETLGAMRASRSCRGRGWVGTPRGPHCRRCRHARAERRHSGSRHEGGARAASPPRQGLARPARFWRRVRVQRDSNERAGAPWVGAPSKGRRAASFFLGLGFPTLWTGSVFSFRA